MALYARVSSLGQKEDLERQNQRLKDYAAAHGYQVSKEVTEIALVSDELRKLRRAWKLLCKVRMSSMKVKWGYKAELDLNNEQITLAKKHCGAARWAYNYALIRKKANYQQGLHTPYATELHREINALKQTDIPWAYEVRRDYAE